MGMKIKLSSTFLYLKCGKCSYIPRLFRNTCENHKETHQHVLLVWQWWHFADNFSFSNLPFCPGRRDILKVHLFSLIQSGSKQTSGKGWLCLQYKKARFRNTTWMCLRELISDSGEQRTSSGPVDVIFTRYRSHLPSLFHLGHWMWSEALTEVFKDFHKLFIWRRNQYVMISKTAVI